MKASKLLSLTFSAIRTVRSKLSSHSGERVRPNEPYRDVLDASELPPAESCDGSAKRNETEQQVRAVLDAYVNAWTERDFSSLPLADDITFKGPKHKEPLRGAETVRRFLTQMLPLMTGIDAVRYIIEGNHAFLVLEFGLAHDSRLVPCADYFYVVDGQIKWIRPYWSDLP